MEEKREKKPAFLEGGIPAQEPEAEEIPLFEALSFSGGEPEETPEPPEPAPEEISLDFQEPEASPEEPEAEPVEPAEDVSPVSEEPETPTEPEASEISPEAKSPAVTVEEPQAEDPKPEEALPENPEAPEEKPEIPSEPSEEPVVPELAEDEEENEEEPPHDLDFREEDEDFARMLDAPDPEEAKKDEPPKAHEPKKGRPKRRKGEGLLGIPNMLATVVWLGLILAIGITAGRMLWVCAADVLAFGREDRPVTVTVYESDDLDSIVEKLYSNGLIRYRSLFRLYAGISHAEEDIDPGIYDLNAKYDYHALVKMMSASSTRTVVKGVLIPEGYTCRQIFNLLEEKRICTAQDLEDYAASGELNDYWFLENVDRGTKYCLEGYLFPDTYDFYRNSTPREVLEKLLDNFNTRFDDDMKAQLEKLNTTVVTGGGYTVKEVTIIASMIEKEAAAPAEAPNIAGVIYNRLFRWGSNPAYLNIDASIVYALDGKNELTREDLQIDSPYNTYTNVGLTPTPISNPGLSSLQAALNPASHNYYYYVLNPSTGMHTFSTTYEEHSGYVAAYAEGQ